MNRTKVAITIKEDVLKRLDQLVAGQQFPSRSRAIEQAVEEKLNRIDHSRLARECANLDPEYEQQLADEGLVQDFTEWPEY